MAQQKVRKAIVTAAGFGTRFLPQTKAMPKEMLPLIDKPIIQYIVEELVDAGIEEIVIVTSYHKRSIEDHFDQMSADLRINLEQGGKLKLLEETKKISDLADFAYIRQKGPYGNATPLLNAEHLMGGEPFIFAFADDFVQASPTRFSQLVKTYEKRGGNVLSCVTATKDADYKKYAFVVGDEVADGLVALQKIVEKPGSYQAVNSKIASVSGYLFGPELFEYLHHDMKTLKDGKEFIMQPAIERMAGDGHKVWGLTIQNGKFYDTGDKLEYIKTVIDFALKHEDIKDDVLAFLRQTVKDVV